MKVYVKILFPVILFLSTVIIAATGASESANFPAWLSILPPLIAILLALITRETLISLFTGIWVGATILARNPFTGLTTSLDSYLVGALADKGHASIILFSLGFGGIIGLISANGGMKGMVKVATKWASTRKRGQFATAIMGVLIFFDDYANTLLVGNMMRPFSDRLRISREKLSYIVDSTAAPIASLAVISTWSIFQMSLLDGPYQQFGVTENPYMTFIKSVPFSFYCILTLVFLFTVVLTRRDFGPMLKAEIRAVKEGKVIRDGATPMASMGEAEGNSGGDKVTHWSNAIIPIFAVIFITMAGLIITGLMSLEPGKSASIRNIIGGADSYSALMWGSYMAGMIALLLTVSKKIMSLKDSIQAWLNGVKAMTLACSILILAWSLGNVCKDLNTATYLVSLSEGIISPGMLPAITFITSAAISFSTGTSWATMSILVPIIMPMALQLLGSDPNVVVSSPIFTSTFAAILSGSVFGDHCSPISDTTILSSMATGSDHIDHVRTQLPYAVTVGVIALLAGYIPIGFGLPFWVSIIIGMVLVFLVIKIFGKKVPRRELAELS